MQNSPSGQDEPFDSDPNVAHVDIEAFIRAFTDSFDASRDFWEQVVERFCRWFGMFGVAILRFEHEAQAEITSMYPTPGGDSASTDEDGDAAPVPEVPEVFRKSRVKWSELNELLTNQPFESRAPQVPEFWRDRQIRNYMLLRFTAPVEGIHRLVFLGNAPLTRVFDAYAYKTCLAVGNLLDGMAHCLTHTIYSDDSVAATADQPLIDVHRRWVVLELQKALAGRYPPATAGQLLRSMLDDWPRASLNGLLEHVLPGLLGRPLDCWDPGPVRDATRSWPMDARASLTRAYLALGKTRVANEILDALDEPQEDGDAV